MSLILNIDCAVENASVCLAENESVTAFQQSTEQKNHASFLQPAIKKLMQIANKNLNELDAVAVTAGPGSYTGLRIGLASAKGLCYALNKPLIAVNTLEVMAQAVINIYSGTDKSNVLFCPMIDARRMEVFTALYNYKLKNILEPCSLLLDENSFAEKLSTHKIVFFGNGSKKFNLINHHTNAAFIEAAHTAADIVYFSTKFLKQGKFEDIAYAAPLYLKAFFSPVKK